MAEREWQNMATASVTLTVLPGPDRKRSRAWYRYRITYRNPDPDLIGCVMTWEVEGGREGYQIALERVAGDALRWHCTCPDAVYRSGVNPDHVCKHVRGLAECLPVAVNRKRLAKSA